MLEEIALLPKEKQAAFLKLKDGLRFDPTGQASTLAIRQYKDDRLGDAYTVPFGTSYLLLHHMRKHPLPVIHFKQLIGGDGETGVTEKKGTP